MRIKHDFVANSSSTSFFLADFRKNEGPIKIKITLEVDLMDFLVETITAEKQVEYRLDGSNELIKECKEILRKGGKIIELSVCSDNNNTGEKLLLDNGISDYPMPDGIQILRGEGGY